jgi:DnaK suppressor protein
VKALHPAPATNLREGRVLVRELDGADTLHLDPAPIVLAVDAMSASKNPAGLTPAQLSTLRTRLLAERARLGESAAVLTPVLEPGERAGDAMDEAEENLEQHDAMGRAAHDRSHSEDVERALLKLDQGTYGVSELSGEPIGYPRLEAVPWARLTAAEQEEGERRARR